MQICVMVIAPSSGHVGPNTIKTMLTGARWRSLNVSTFIHRTRGWREAYFTPFACLLVPQLAPTFCVVLVAISSGHAVVVRAGA
jgi:hypothetical protein